MSILLEPDREAAETLRIALPGEVQLVDSVPSAHRVLTTTDEVLVVVGPDVDLAQALEMVDRLRLERPEVGVVLLRRRLDVTLLGQALRAGVREVVGPDDLAALAEACQRSLRVSERQGGASTAGPAAHVTVVFSAKGGCGKTTVATNLAVTLAEGGRKKVCLVDLDLAFGDCAIALQLMPSRTITDAVAMAGHLDAEGVRSITTKYAPGVDTICAPLEPGEAERIPVTVVSELLDLLKQMYDHVVIDTPPAFTEHVLASFDLADHYVLLATLDIPALKNLRLTLDMLDLLGYPRESWLVVLNRSDSKVGLTVGDVEQTLRTRISALVPSSRAVSASINKGVPLVVDEPGHPVSVAIRDLSMHCQVTREAHEAVAEEPSRRRRRRALLRRGRG